jgi:NADH-quinone oxidoreductase subunit M
MSFPILSVIAFTPITTGIVLLFLPGERKTLIRWVALAAASFALALSLVVYVSYDRAAAGYQFVEQVSWIPSLGISYHVGVDGMNLPLVLLTGIVIFTGVLISWGIDDRPREFFAFLFILATGVFGVFISLDLFQLFFFYEIAVFPMYLLISIWGWQVTREYAAMKLTLYLFIGSVIASSAAWRCTSPPGWGRSTSWHWSRPASARRSRGCGFRSSSSASRCWAASSPFTTGRRTATWRRRRRSPCSTLGC